MQEIRAGIDALDKEIIGLLGRRFGYVKAASKFKTSEGSVRAPERFETMLVQRRIWAEGAGLSSDVIEKMFRDLVAYFIEEEMQRFNEHQ